MKPTSLTQIAQWLGGTLDLDKPENKTITHVGIDSRALVDGQLFIAIVGEKHDAHTFIDQAQVERAAAVVVSRPVKTKLPQILVADTRLALGKLAHAYRKTFQGHLVAVTGSNGKTTVKEMLASICAQKGKTAATYGNLNNDYGMPLTLLTLSDEAYAVIEMGANHHGEIDYLTRIAEPAAAVITNAGNAHLEGFGSIDGVAKAKGEIFTGLAANGVAVINVDDSRHPVWLELAKNKRIFTYGIKHKADFSAQTQQTTFGTLVNLHTPQGETQFTLALLGLHNVLNALAAAAVSSAIGIDLKSITQGLEAMQAVKGRLQWKKGTNGMRLLDDTYNANPSSMSAAFQVLATLGGNTWAILGDMGELGENSIELHQETGRLARRAGLQRLLTYGEKSKFTSDEFGEGGNHFTSIDELVNTVRREWPGEGAILVKGSRAMQMERFVAALENNSNTRET